MNALWISPLVVSLLALSCASTNTSEFPARGTPAAPTSPVADAGLEFAETAAFAWPVAATSSAPRSTPGAVSQSLAPPGPVVDDLRTQLSMTRLSSLDLTEETSLRSVVRFIGRAASVNVLVDAEAEEAAEMPLGVKRERPISALDALNLVVELAGDGVKWVPYNGVVVVTTPEKAPREYKTVVLDVSDLLYGIPSYPAPELGDLRPADMRGEFGVVERTPYFESDALLELIRSTIAPDTWDDGENSITLRGGRLFVRHD